MIVFLTTHQFQKLMSAINDLTAALAAQTTSINSLTAAVLVAVPEINPVSGAGATEAQVSAFATQVAANNALVDAQTAAIVKATTPPAAAAPAPVATPPPAG